jgi:hypothetical protein
MAVELISAQRDFEASLAALDAEGLREFLRGLERGADHEAELVEVAARRLGGAPYLEPDPKLYDDAVRIAKSAKRKGDHRRPEIERVLSRARRLLLRGDAAEARRVYELVLGLAADLTSPSREALVEQADAEPEPPSRGFAHAGSYLVSVYESCAPDARVDTMLDAVERLSAVDVISSPIELMTSAAVRPLEGLRELTREWARLLEAIAGGIAPGPTAWSPSHAMLAEALERIDGIDGLARAARRSGELSQYRTWVMRIVAEGRFADAIGVASEAGATLSDAFGRGLMLDAALALAERANDHERALVLVERAFLADPSTSRLARWLLWGDPSALEVEERSRRARQSGVAPTARMDALMLALEGAVDDLTAVLAITDHGWGGDENAGPLAFPTLLLLLYGAPNATPVSARICAPLFSASVKADPCWRGWAPPSSLFGEPSTPDPGPFIAARAGHGLRDARPAAEVLRHAAAVRASGVLESRERAAFEPTAALVVAAAESTLHAGESDVARSYLGEVALAAARHPAFRGALTKTLAKSTLVNAL